MMMETVMTYALFLMVLLNLRLTAMVISAGVLLQMLN